MTNLNTRTVTITKVTKNSVTHSEGLSCHPSNFQNAKVGQQWEITTDDSRFLFGEIVSTKLIQDVKS